MGDLQAVAAQLCESIGKNTGHIAAVADRDSIIAVAGAPKRELLEKRNSAELEQLMEPRLYIGRCPQQVRKFLDACTPLLRQAQAADGDIRI